MTLPRSVADVIAHHVTWELEGIDRMYLNLYVPGLQSEAPPGTVCGTWASWTPLPAKAGGCPRNRGNFIPPHHRGGG